MGAAGRIRSRARSTGVLVGAALVLVAVAVACRPVPLGSAGSSIGNQLSSDCPQSQPSSALPCGPQPLHWAAIQGPYEDFANGDPFATKCARSSPAVSAAACSTGSYPGGATNPTYDPTGYEYAIDVAAEDVGTSLTFQVWDAGVYARSVGATVTTRTLTANRVTGSSAVTGSGSAFSAADVGETITGTGIPAGAVVTSLISTTSVTISAPALSSGSGSVTLSSTPDCRTNLLPFTAPPYLQQQVTNQSCQTGDSTGASGSAPLQVQVFENDGNDLTVDYQVPMPACHLYVPPVSDPARYRNTWATVCTFTPSQVGIYPVRVKSSAITLPDGTPIADVGGGWNGFAMRVTGATGTSLYAVDALSIWSNTPGLGRTYLAEVGSDAAGKALVIDLFDVGDASGTGDYAVQVLGPPSGAPNRVPTTGLVIPSPGTADTCRYNPAPSATQGPDVSGAAGADATSCRVVTRQANINRYNNGWLRIQIDVADDYACASDCWWTLRYDVTGGLGPNDRTVWKVAVVDLDAIAAATTTTTTTTEPEPTTTTSTVPIPLGSPRNPPPFTPPSG